MSNKKCKPDELANVILEYLENFKDVTEEACEKGVSETAKTALQELRNAHPPGSGKYGSWDKSYNKGWRVMQTKRDKKYHKKATIHHATNYQLTHLLEKGHATRDGGRTQSFTHIAPVAEKCEDELLKNIKKWI